MARDRRNPARNFNFRVLFGALGGAAALGVLGTVVAIARRKKKPKPNPEPEPMISGPRPIEVVGTSTASRTAKRAAPGRARRKR